MNKLKIVVFLMALCFLHSWIFSNDAPINLEEKPAPKAIPVPVPEPVEEKPIDIPKALPVKENLDDDVIEVPKAIPLKEIKIEDVPEEVNEPEEQIESEKKDEPPKEFELPPLPPIQDNILKELEKENQDVRAEWETQTLSLIHI